MAEEGLREMNTELSKRAISEMIGTFALVFIGTGAIVVNDMTGGSISHLGISLAFGLTVMTMIYAVGDVSGAHLNPAVSMAFWAARRLPGRELVTYWVGQLSGAVLASLCRLSRAALGPSVACPGPLLARL